MNFPSDGGSAAHATGAIRAAGRAEYGFDGGFMMPLAGVVAVAIVVISIATRKPESVT